ncbi:DUF4244 domain-containing protein [Dactylosporangium darangshiense]|uniref:DUF4244 domain-containing protein n=1 Tax=Dactylosporangium darangshiense TaxID=579108 RepID=A0ABP8CU35_9ACTN
MYTIKARLLALRRGEEGSISLEYAATMVVGVILAGVLIAVVSSDQVRDAFTRLVMRNLA